MCKYVVCVFIHSFISIFLFLRSESWRITQSTCRLQRQDSVSPHVEKCLQEIEREMSSERQSMSARRPEQCGNMSDKLQEALSSDLASREQQQLRMLEQLKETQGHSEAERAHALIRVLWRGPMP
ncbi:centrosomal protein of 128 kDa-like [Salvelinus fontinalis]|uniref:centrosomal protein of 128 kDa-like n=1 Tax=Salvelinus fontinalis TaxID=8038 RepID=UPI00248515C1|nr:centrosomal protein of 128 kDa-like [Salvelinus fontinalis]